jgi:hypothetical protein
LSNGWRCAASSLARGEEVAGTASIVRAFLLLAQPGPWGVDALRDSRLPGSLGSRLEERCRQAGVRPLLIRPHGRPDQHAVRCFAAYAGAWLETTVLAGVEDVLSIDVEALGRGVSPGLARFDRPLFLVCTHGRHDACCAELGRPLAAAMCAAHPQDTWECSHIGGDRFAGNLMVLPDGVYYGRVDAASGPSIAAAPMRGELDLQHLRGRTAFPFAVQAAEWHLRSRLDVRGVGDVSLDTYSARSEVTDAVFAVGGRRWLVRVRTSQAEPTQLTCKAARLRRAPRFELLGLEPL